MEHVYIVRDYDYGGGTLGAVFSCIETAEAAANDSRERNEMIANTDGKEFHYNDVKNIYRVIKVKLDDASELDTVKIIRGDDD